MVSPMVPVGQDTNGLRPRPDARTRRDLGRGVPAARCGDRRIGRVHPPIPTVQAGDVAADATVLDVREDDEWAAGHIAGATHVPLSQLPGRAADIPDTDPLVVVCRVGGRSAQVTAWLVDQGRDAANLDGGLHAWAAAGRPLVTPAGTPGHVA